MLRWMKSLSAFAMELVAREYPRISMDWLVYKGNFYRKAPWSSWENRWFPVKIFPTNPLRTVSHCGWGIPIFVGEPWNAMHTPFETGFVGVRGPFQGVTAYSGFQKRLGGWPSDSEKNIAEKTSANRWIIMMKSWKTLHKKSSAWHHSVFMPSSLPS